MSMIYNPNIIGNESMVGSPIISKRRKNDGRSAGPIIQYEFKSLRPKKQTRELVKVLLPERKKVLGVKLNYRFSIKDRCVVCGVHHIWEVSDELRPPIPLSHTTKGRPLRGTYCPKHSSFFKQLETLEQQMIAEKHGLEFKRYIPKTIVPQMIKRGPLVQLTEADIISLTSKGWKIQPPQADIVGPAEKLQTLLLDLKGKLGQIDEILGVE